MLPKNHPLIPAKLAYHGYGLPGLQLVCSSLASVPVAEFAFVGEMEFTSGTPFVDESSNLLFFYCGVARPTGNDVYLYCVHPKVSFNFLNLVIHNFTIIELEIQSSEGPAIRIQSGQLQHASARAVQNSGEGVC